MRGFRLLIAVALIACAIPRVAWTAEPRRATPDVPAPYKSTRDQTGHELVKTEDFVVPVGTTVAVKGLEFDGPTCTLSPDQERIMRQVFNSLEEITENTVNDTDTARVAEFKKMKFEIRGYSSFAGNPKKDKVLAEDCANVIMTYLTTDGTPAWRLTAKGLGSKTPAARGSSTQTLRVEFARTK